LRKASRSGRISSARSSLPLSGCAAAEGRRGSGAMQGPATN
jgi:hypothetical protein